MGAPAIFGITNDGLNLAVKLLLLVMIAIWLSLVFWTYADARRRIADPMLVTCASAAAFIFPFVGAIVYAIVRPPEYLDDVRERELEIAAAEARLFQAQELACPNCGHEVEKTFLRCPSCATRLKEPCQSCGRPLDPRWQICPYCEAEVTQAAATAQRRGRGRRPATGGAERSAAARSAEREVRDRERVRPARETRPARERPLDAERDLGPEPAGRGERVLPREGGRTSADPEARVSRAREPLRAPDPDTRAPQPPERRPGVGRALRPRGRPA
jgi:hypothetical protein